jgi:serine/threonine protein kinase
MTEERPTIGDCPTPAGTAPADLPIIPGYEILQELGRGGMGVVYKARQVVSNRLVALKLIRDGALAGPKERGRFRIEAEAAARMGHPNIVQIYEVGEHASRAYFAMELIEGGSLDKHFAGQPQPARLASELVRTLARAVQHAHEQKIIHRDLKPANILLAVTSDQWLVARKGEPEPLTLATSRWPLTTIPKITDFSLAKRLDSDSTAWTRDGDVLGTASYMAPEQAAGRVQVIGPAADIYSLGAILFELLTGQPPFLADSWNETIQQVLFDEPRAPTRLRPDVPCDLETICLKCLEKQPDQRYASAEELAEDLDRFLAGKSVTAVPLSERDRLGRLAARDGFEIVGEIGRGPRSTVYHALFGPLKQPLALKVFAPGICTEGEWQNRLRRAAETWALLAHPHLVPVQRAGWWDSSPYVALEYIPQGSLAAKLTGKPYSIAEALRLLEQLAEIVGYLHRQGVVHGNLKPSNVLLAADGIPRIVDFQATGGLFQGPLRLDDQDPTGLRYLAPELVQDPLVELRLHADIYGLGLIFYELVTGRPIFGGVTGHEILEQVRSQDPAPPSTINPKVTPQMDGFCLRCLKRNPWRRYHRAYDVIRRLRYFQEKLEGRHLPEGR